MSSPQILLNAVLFAMIFAIALELKPVDFVRVAKHPLPVAAGLIAQFVLLPVVTFIVIALVRDRHLLSAGIAGLFIVVILHNATGLAIGYFSGKLARLAEMDRRDGGGGRWPAVVDDLAAAGTW
jgi:predicted Na+-dependent transporter